MSASSEKRIYTNQYIRSEDMVLLDEDWEKIGFFSKNDALKKAEEESKDLIQVWFNPKDRVAIVKLMELWKYLYKKKKEESEKRKSQKSKSLKEIKFSYNIWDNDLDLKIEKAKKFLSEGHSVKLMWQLRWRENIYWDKLFERMKNIESELSDISRGQWIKKEKRWYSMILFAKIK